MSTSSPQRLVLLAICCSVAAASAFGDSVQPRDLSMPADLAGEPCRFTDPNDPQRILGPNPAHGSCLTALYPPAMPNTYGLESSSDTAARMATETEESFSISLASTVWLYIIGIGMLVLAGFNSRKRHRYLPQPDSSGGYAPPPEPLQTHSESARWKEE